MREVSREARSIASNMRRVMAQQINYHYGRYGFGDYRSDGSKWPGGITASGRGIVLDHRLLRQNARSSYHEDTVSRAIVERYVETVAGIGLVCESSPRHEILGISHRERPLQRGDPFFIPESDLPRIRRLRCRSSSAELLRQEGWRTEPRRMCYVGWSPTGAQPVLTSQSSGKRQRAAGICTK